MLIGVVHDGAALLIDIRSLRVIVGKDFVIRGLLLIGQERPHGLIALLIHFVTAAAEVLHLVLGLGPDRVHFLTLLSRELELIGDPGARHVGLVEWIVEPSREAADGEAGGQHQNGHHHQHHSSSRHNCSKIYGDSSVRFEALARYQTAAGELVSAEAMLVSDCEATSTQGGGAADNSLLRMSQTHDPAKTQAATALMIRAARMTPSSIAESRRA